MAQTDALTGMLTQRISKAAGGLAQCCAVVAQIALQVVLTCMRGKRVGLYIRSIIII